MLTNAFVAIIFVLLASFLFKKNKNEFDNYFSLICLGVFLWNFIYFYRSSFPENYVLGMILLRTVFLGPILTILGGLQFASIYPNKIFSDKFRYVIGLINLIAISTILLTPAVVKDIRYHDGILDPVYGPCHFLYGLYYLINLALMLWATFLQVKNAYDAQKPQMQSIYILATALVVGAVTNVFLPVFHNRTFIVVGPLVSGLILIYLIFFSLRKYQLIVIDNTYRRMIIAIVYLSFSYPIIQLLIQNPHFKDEFKQILFITIIILYFVFYPFFNYLLNIFMGGNQKQKTKMTDLAATLFTIEDYEKLIPHLKNLFQKLTDSKLITLIDYNYPNYSIVSEFHRGLDWNLFLPFTEPVSVFQIELKYKNELLNNGVRAIIPIISNEAKILILVGHRENHSLYEKEDFEAMKFLSEEIKKVIKLAKQIESNKSKQSQLFQTEKTALIGQLTAGVVHEIRNPLTSMTMTLENMKEALIESGADKQTIEKLSQAGQRSAQEMKDFLKSLLDFSRKEEFVKKKFMLGPVIEETMRLINKTAKSHQVNIQTEIGEGLELNTDDRKIKQVLINLALNAIDAMPKGGTLSFKAYKDNVSSIYIEVSDTGHGIPEDKQKHLFTPFFTTKESGTGLGLTIIKEIMDLHQAEISFVSSNQGTTFKLKFN